MNWLRQVKRILGGFWHDIFTQQDFILGVEKAWALACKGMEARREASLSSMFTMEPPLRLASGFYPVYFDADSARRPYSGFTSGLLSSDASAELLSMLDDGNDSEWVVTLVGKADEPVMLTDNPDMMATTLLAGPDFTYNAASGTLTLKVNPASMMLDSAQVVDDSGMLHSCSVLYGCCRLSAPDKDAVSGFYGCGLTPVSGYVWDMHVNGATLFGIKRLLAYAAGAVICENDGVVNDIWTEGAMHCVRVGDRVYISQATPSVSYLDSVSRGSVLFGDIAFYTGAEDSCGIPSMRVMTDAGAVTVANSTQSLVGNSVLPVSGENQAAYTALCNARNADLKCPYVDLTQYATAESSGGVTVYRINPFRFIAGRVRGCRSMYAMVGSFDAARLRAVVGVLGKCINASGILSIYVTATTSVLTVPVSCSADIETI